MHSLIEGYHEVNIFLADYICASPIAESCGVTYSDDLDQVAHWEKLGELLSQRLGHPSGDDASEQQRYCAAGQASVHIGFLCLMWLLLQGASISVLPSHIPLAAKAPARTQTVAS